MSFCQRYLLKSSGKKIQGRLWGLPRAGYSCTAVNNYRISFAGVTMAYQQLPLPPIVVQAQPVVVTSASGMGGLLPPPSMDGQWRFGLSEKAYTFQNDCWIAWCCGCFQLGQIAEKLRAVGEHGCAMGYCAIVGAATILWFLDGFIAPEAAEEDSTLAPCLWMDFCPGTSYHIVFIAIIACQLRSHVRRVRNISGTPTKDCCVTWFCLPCSITQMVGEMWEDPSIHPGCHLTGNQAHYV